MRAGVFPHAGRKQEQHQGAVRCSAEASTESDRSLSGARRHTAAACQDVRSERHAGESAYRTHTYADLCAARGRRNCTAMRKRSSDHRARCSGASYFRRAPGRKRRGARSHDGVLHTRHATPNQHASAGSLASIRADPARLLAVPPATADSVQLGTAGVQSSIAHGARAGTLTFPGSAGWLRAG